MTEIISEAREHMDKAIEALKVEFNRVRTGRPNPALLDNITVDYYGCATPIRQIANVKAGDGHMLVVDPYDKSALRLIEKAIMNSDLGITPSNDGVIIRLPFPAPSEEGRKELVKQCRDLAEHARVSCRNIRRDANAKYEKLDKDGEMGEDDVRRGQAEVQKVTDAAIATIEKVLKDKEAEVMEV